jgi:hypothetical protein
MDDSYYWLWIILSLAVAYGVLRWSRKIEREIKEVEKDVTILLNNVLFMRIETHDSMIFAYDVMSGEFVCQGSDMDELNKNFGIRYPARKGILVEDKEAKGVL